MDSLDSCPKGTIIELGGTITVRSEEGNHYKGWLKKSHQTVYEDKTNALALGDEVSYQLKEDIAVIHRIFPPKTVLLRQSTHKNRKNQIIASNLDQAMVVIAKNYPQTPIGMIDRMLIAIQSGGMKALLVINKDDENDDLHPEITQIYAPLGISIHRVSAKEKTGIPELQQLLFGKKTIFLGISGVGKTSLVMALTGIDLRISNLNEIAKSGKHTTSHSQLYEMDKNTFIADIPGIKQLGLIDLESVISFYPEIAAHADQCKFRSCTHTHEPQCAVLDAIKRGIIHPKRLASFQKLIQEQVPQWER